MKKQQLIEMIKKIVYEEKSRKFLKENINPSTWIAVVWESGSSTPEPIAIFVLNQEHDLNRIGQGELADILQSKLRRPIDPNDFEVDSPMTFSDFQEEYGNVNNPRRININNYPHIQI